MDEMDEDTLQIHVIFVHFERVVVSYKRHLVSEQEEKLEFFLDLCA